MPDSARVRLSELARLVGWAVVLIAMSILVIGGVLAAQRSWNTLHSEKQRAADAADVSRYSCLETELRRQLPAHSTVVDAGADIVDFQRIAEELSPGYRFVTKAQPGAYRVTFASPGPCEGVGVRVAHLP